jgi:glycerol uptake facilitator-like aquaporin
MNTRNTISKFTSISLLIVLVFTGFQFGELVNTLAPQIPRGILGAIVVYLVYRNVLFPIKRESIDALFSFPTNIKYFIYSFFVSVIIYWGLQQIFFMLIMKK